MKSIIKYLLSAVTLMVVFVSCRKAENKIYFEGGTAPVLTASRTGTVPLSFANKDQEALKLSWTNPNYQFTTGVSSHNVTYTLEIDTTGANFTNPNRKVITISNDLSLSMTQHEFNDYLLNQLQLVPGRAANVEIRATAAIAGTDTRLRSNVLKFTATPYAIPPKVDPPASGELYIVGSATPGGWNNPVPVPSQRFTRVNTTFFEITLPLTGGGSYLFLPVNGSWNAKYGALGANNTNNPNGDDFKPGGGDMIAPAENGTYKIQVDFQRGKFTVTKM